ncbi:Rieske 2Fe-2S domain-containing protein [Spirillospora sp. NPDC050679]
MAVIESARLKDRPVQVHYWGSPVVVYRERSGRVRALEDRCAHRGVRLSKGTVLGDRIRCDFHRFVYDGRGRCVEIPEEFGAGADLRERCSVRRYFAREAVGLVWVSVEDAPDAPFPVEPDLLPDDHFVGAGRFHVTGDIRVWMDHYLDIPHCLWAHAETAYWGMSSAPATLADKEICIRPDSTYPIRPAVRMRFHVQRHRPVRYDPKMTVVSLLDITREKLRPSRRGTASYFTIQANLVTPLCQEGITHLGLSKQVVRYWTAINPIADDKSVFYWAAVVPRHGDGPLRRLAKRRVLGDFAERHLGREDGLYLEDAPFVDGDDFVETELDATVHAMRTIFTDYQRRKAHLYAPGSLMRSLDYRHRRPDGA